MTDPTDKLSAVNQCLNNIGEAPVTSLDSGLLVDAQVALDVVEEVNRTVQSKGWYFNTETMTLTPNTSNNISLPNNTLKVDTTGTSIGYDLIKRGTRLYDRENNTFTITAKKELEITLLLDFEDLSEPFKVWIATMAARTFQERQLGVDSISNQNREDERKAKASAMQEETDMADYNVGTGSYSTYKILRRRGPR